MRKMHFYLAAGLTGLFCLAAEGLAQPPYMTNENNVKPYRLSGSRGAPLHDRQPERMKADLKAAEQSRPRAEKLNQTQKNMVRHQSRQEKTITQKAGEKWQDVKEGTADKWQNVKEGTAEKWQDVKEGTADKWQDVKEGTADKWQNVKEGTAEKWQNITESADEKTNRLAEENAHRSEKVVPETNHPSLTNQHPSLEKAPVQNQTPPSENTHATVKGHNGGDAAVLMNDNDTTSVMPIVHGKTARGRKATSPSFLSRADRDVNSWANAYAHAKNELLKETGLSYTLDVSFMGQRGAPSGHITPWQSQYYGAVTWDMFDSNVWGSGSANLAYELVRYWNGNGAELGSNIGVVTPLNDYTDKANYFYELSYTHQLPGKADWLSVTLGQFPLYNFDGTTYDSNQQINFVNESFAQNATSTYPSAGLGGYLTVSPDAFWSVSAGGQDAENIEGDRISGHHWGKKFTSFISGTINPKNKWGQATLSVLFYNQPSVDEQPEKTQGWSVNAQQNLGRKWAVFMRANGVSKGINGLNQSYVIGGVYNNPLNRNALDQIGVAGAVNKLNKAANGEGSRSVENMLEAYWAWGISSFMTITPDVQFYINPGLNQKSNTATVASVRATMMF